MLAVIWDLAERYFFRNERKRKAVAQTLCVARLLSFNLIFSFNDISVDL